MTSSSRVGPLAAQAARGVRPPSRDQAGRRGLARFLGLFRRAQVSVEARHLKNRIDLLVHERQRQEILKDIGADPYVD